MPATYRFLSRLWNLVQEFKSLGASHEPQEGGEDVLRAIHSAIKKVTEDIEKNHYNTAIAAMMGCLNDLYKLKSDGFAEGEAWQSALESLVALVAPAPHTTEELWHQLGHSTSVHRDTWPRSDEKYLASETMTIAVQINGKLRTQLELPADADENAVKAAADADKKVQAHTAGKKIIKTIYVPGKILNIVEK